MFSALSNFSGLERKFWGHAPAAYALATVAGGFFRIWKNRHKKIRRPNCFQTEFWGPHPGGHGAGTGRNRKLKSFFPNSKKKEFKKYTQTHFENTILGVAFRRHGHGQGSQPEIKVFFFEFEKFEIKKFRRPQNLGTEFLGRHPGGMGTGKGRGRK